MRIIPEYRYPVLFELAEEVLRAGLANEGGTLDEAHIMAQDAIRGYPGKGRVPLLKEVYLLLPARALAHVTWDRAEQGRRKRLPHSFPVKAAQAEGIVHRFAPE